MTRFSLINFPDYMMVPSIIEKYNQWLDDKEPAINTFANHLIVIFSFSVPVLVEARRTSLVLLILLFLIRGRVLTHIRKALLDPVVLAFSLYFLVHVIWLAGTDDTSRAGEVIHDASFMLIPLLFSTFIDSRFAPRIFAAFFAGMGISILISFGIFFEILPPMYHDGSQGDWRDPTPFYHHTHYGYMLALTSVVLLARFFTTARMEGNRIIWSVLMVGAAMNIFIIAGRSGFVLLVMLVPVLYLLFYRKKAFVPLIVLGLVLTLVTVVAYNISSTFSHRVNTTAESVEKLIHETDYDSSLGGRAAITVISMGLASDHWLLGMGTADHTGQILETIEQEYSNLDFLFDKLAHPHNEYINALLQFGVLGLMAFINIPLQLLRYKNENKDNELMFKLIGISILFYVLQDVMVIDQGMLFTVVVLVSAGLRSYSVDNAVLERFNLRQAGGYGLAMLVFYLLKQI